MGKNRHEFGRVERVEPDAIGKPGQRRFRLLIEGGNGVACLWLEKEQLQALELAIGQLLSGSPLSVEWPRPNSPRKLEAGVNFPRPDVEFRVGRLALGFDESSDEFMLLAHDVDSDQEGPPTFTCLTSRDQLRVLGEHITSVTGSGRHTCPLCGSPLEQSKHICPRQNGHT